jgi:hypothetical protein
VQGVGSSRPDCDMCHEALLEDRDDPGQVSLHNNVIFASSYVTYPYRSDFSDLCKNPMLEYLVLGPL